MAERLSVRQCNVMTVTYITKHNYSRIYLQFSRGSCSFRNTSGDFKQKWCWFLPPKSPAPSLHLSSFVSKALEKWGLVCIVNTEIKEQTLVILYYRCILQYTSPFLVDFFLRYTIWVASPRTWRNTVLGLIITRIHELKSSNGTRAKLTT